MLGYALMIGVVVVISLIILSKVLFSRYYKRAKLCFRDDDDYDGYTKNLNRASFIANWSHSIIIVSFIIVVLVADWLMGG